METQKKSLWWLICHDICATPWTQGIASSRTVVLHMTTKINVITNTSLREQRKQ